MYLWWNLRTLYFNACEVRKMYLWWNLRTLYFNACEVRKMYLWWNLRTLYFNACEVRKVYLWWNLCTLYFNACEVRKMYLWWNLRTLYFNACEVRKMYLWWNLRILYFNACEVRKMYLWWNLRTLYFNACEVRKVYLWWNLRTLYFNACEVRKMYLWWNLRTLYVLACQVRVTVGGLRPVWLCLRYVFRALINALVCRFIRWQLTQYMIVKPSRWQLNPVGDSFKVFKVLLSFWALGARKRSYIRTRHSLWTSTWVLLINNYHTLYIKINKCSNTNQSCYKGVKINYFFFFFSVVFHSWLSQNNSRIQLINLASLIFLDFHVIFMRLQNLGTLWWCV